MKFRLGKKYYLIFLILFFIIFIFLGNGDSPNKKNDIFYEGNGIKNDSKNDLIKSSLIRVVDGDTLILKIKNKTERVRLVGLNTPEAKNINGRKVECFGKEASVYAKRILETGDDIYFKVNDYDNRDQYGRLLGFVFFKNQSGEFENFAEKMIRGGYGYEYTYHGQGYRYQKEFKSAEDEARRLGRGLWAKGVCDNSNLE